MIIPLHYILVSALCGNYIEYGTSLLQNPQGGKRKPYTLEHLFMMRPSGVVSKKDMGALRSRFNMSSWMWNEAATQPTAQAVSNTVANTPGTYIQARVSSYYCKTYIQARVIP